jgi:hypothetical protein
MQFFYSRWQENSIEDQPNKADLAAIRLSLGAAMLQLFFDILRQMRASAQSPPPIGYRVECPSDPLSHPVLKAMGPRELADIPFPRPRSRRSDPGQERHGE